MGFINDLRKDFYDVIDHQRVLILVGFDVDALAACKILLHLFQCDHVPYTVVPVSGREDLESAYQENSEGVKYVVMLNCGGNFDVIELLQPEDKVLFYICDSHRPIDVFNAYNAVQVKMLVEEREAGDDLPEYDQVFRDDESDEDDSGNESEGSEPSGKKRRFNPEALEKRRNRRLWEEKRTNILFEYEQYSKYGKSAALTMYQMAWKMSKDTNDLLWLAILGVTDQFINFKVDRDVYMSYIDELQHHVSRHNHRGDDVESTISVNCLRITYEEELQLTLYRHWSLFESLCHSPYLACKFRVWTMKGRKKLHEFLADMGLPLVQCQQKWTAMDVNFKDEISSMILDKMEKYGFDKQYVFLPSFHASYGYKNKVCATDVVLACSSVLESIDRDASMTDSFLSALDVLTRANVEAKEKCLGLAKMQTKAIVSQVQSFLDMNQIVSAGPFLYAFIQPGTLDVKFFSKAICLQRLAHYTLEAYASVCKSKKNRALPLVLGAPLDAELGTTIIIGIPPILDESRRSFFGKAFEQAGEMTNSRMLLDSFDSHIIQIKSEDKSKFFDALIGVLQ